MLIKNKTKQTDQINKKAKTKTKTKTDEFKLNI